MDAKRGSALGSRGAGEPDPLGTEFLRILRPALEQAAAVARALEGRVANRPKADAESPAKAALTVADTAVQETLLVPLLERFANARLDAEEDTPSVSRFRGDQGELDIVIDPIDGTLRFFLQARGPYAVMAGLAREGRFAAALVALPREGVTFGAVRGQGAWIATGGVETRPPRPDAESRRVLVSYELPETVSRRLVRAGYEPVPGCGGAIAVAPLVPGCCGGIRVAAGTGSISRRGRIGLLIAREAGVTPCTASGRPFPETLDAPESALVVPAGPEQARAFVDALAD